MSKKAVILLSGGLDSATVLAIAQAQGYECYGLSFRYGQRHESELVAATGIAKQQGVVQHLIIPLDFAGIGGSALTDHTIEVPASLSEGIPITYVPARNTIFLAYALGWAEVLEADDIFIGVNAVDYSGYPDCRPEFMAAFSAMANFATKRAVEGDPITLHTPLLELSKGDIIRQGMALGVDYGVTVSCYQADESGDACGVCDSCRLRKQGFIEAGIRDPTRYK